MVTTIIIAALGIGGLIVVIKLFSNGAKSRRIKRAEIRIEDEADDSVKELKEMYEELDDRDSKRKESLAILKSQKKNGNKIDYNKARDDAWAGFTKEELLEAHTEIVKELHKKEK